MTLIEWSDSLSVNIREIDTQHKKLVAMINDMFEAMRERRGKQAVSGIVSRMKDYAREHFATEERYMERHAFPGLSSHRVEHDKFIEKVLDLELTLQEGGSVVSMEVMNFLKGWLTTHIMGSDKEFGPFLNGKGVR